MVEDAGIPDGDDILTVWGDLNRLDTKIERMMNMVMVQNMDQIEVISGNNHKRSNCRSKTNY